MGFKHKQCLSEEVFWKIIHIQTYNWTKYALCESTLSGGLQAEAMGFRSFSKHYTQSNIQLNNVCALPKFTEWWDSSRSNGSQKKFFETLYTFKPTIEQSMRTVKVQWVVGFKQKQWVSEEIFQKIIHIQAYNWTMYALCKSALSGGLQAGAMARGISFFKQYTHSNIQLHKVCILWKYTEWWASSRSNGFQKKFFKTWYIFKHTLERSMRSLKVHWVVAFEQNQWLAEHVFWNFIHMQTYNWTKYALCESGVSVGLQAQAMSSRRIFLKHYTHSNIHLNKTCLLRKYTEWWASSRSNGFQKKFFKTIYTFNYTIEQSMHSVKVHWVVGFKQKEWLAEEIFSNIIHMETYNWTKYALCGKVHWVVGFKQKQWLRRRSFFQTFYISKHTIEQNMHTVKVHWVVGFKQKQWVSEEVFQNIIHIQTYTWTKSALLWKWWAEWWASSKHTIAQSMHSVEVHWVVGFKQKQRVSEEIFQNIHIQWVCALWVHWSGGLQRING